MRLIKILVVLVCLGRARLGRLALALALRVGLRCGRCCSDDTVGRVGASSVVDNLSARDATLGALVLLRLGSELSVLRDTHTRSRGVDDHDHALLAVLRLGAVDVHRLVVHDRDHEHGRVTRLALVVLVLLSAFLAIGSGSGVVVGASGCGDGLEVAEDGIPLRCARGVGIGRGNRVILKLGLVMGFWSRA